MGVAAPDRVSFRRVAEHTAPVARTDSAGARLLDNAGVLTVGRPLTQLLVDSDSDPTYPQL